MSSLQATVTVLVMTISLAAVANDEDREARQAELDAACEAARDERLIPMREKAVSDCVEKEEFDSLEKCEKYYADFGERAGGRQAMFYNLPACVEAFEYAQSERESD